MEKTNKNDIVKYLLEISPTENRELWEMLCSHYYVLGKVSGRTKMGKETLTKILNIAKEHNIQVPNERFNKYLEDMKILKSE